MRHRNKVKHLGMLHSHREAMFSNMVASFYLHERIVTTRQKAKELKRISEKLITRAKKNVNLSEGDRDKKLHNKRIVMQFIRNRDAVVKLFDDIAPRFAGRNGGYTRIYLLGRRSGDAAEMAMIELVDRKVTEKKTAVKEKSSSKPAKEETKSKKEKKSDK